MRRAHLALALLSTVATIALIVTVEVTLRWLDVARPDPLYEQFLEQQLQYLRPCRDLHDSDQMLAAVHAEATKRVTILGESSGELLGTELKRLEWPGLYIANLCAQGGSHFRHLQARLQETLAATTHAIVIVFGHNYDFPEPPSRWRIRLQQLRTRSRIMTAFGALFAAPARPPLVQRDLAPYEAFLRQAAAQCRERGIELVLNTMAANYFYPPMASEPPLTLYAARLRRAGGERATATRELAALSATSDDAGTAFELGIWLYEDGDYEAAHAALERALALDGERSRAGAPQAEMIRRVARATGVQLRDTVQVLAADSPDGFIGWEAMRDHCHLQPEQVQREAIATLSLLGLQPNPHPGALAALSGDAFDGALRYLDHLLDLPLATQSEWNVVMPIWRFLHLGVPRIQERATAWVEARARQKPATARRDRALVLGALGQANFLMGHVEAAHELNRRARKVLPDLARLWVWKGLYDVALHDVEAARAAFTKALTIEPSLSEANWYLTRLD